jgi:hypothetical protein
MKNLRRIAIFFLLAVATLSAVRSGPAFAAQTKAAAAAHHCDCDDHCNLGKPACDAQSLCATACNGLVAAVVTFTPPAESVRDSVRRLPAALRDGITRPPPLGPPRA